MTSPTPPHYEDIYRFTSLLAAFRRARKAQRGKGAEPVFYRDLEENLLALAGALRKRTFKPDPYRYFRLRNTKERLVAEASFRDRVVHHALVTAQEPVFEARFIEHSYACRRGKGTHLAVERAQRLCQRHHYVLRLDVQKFFDHINHVRLLETLGEATPDTGIIWLCETLLRNAQVPSVPKGEARGVPIGNLTSQFWANVYLDPLDHFVVETIGHGAYARYMDDLILCGDDKRTLWLAAEEIGAFLRERLHVRLKSRATQLVPVSEGVPWLGWRVFPGLTRLDRRGRKRFGRKIVRSVGEARDVANQDDEVARAASLCGHLEHGDTLEMRRDILRRLDVS